MLGLPAAAQVRMQSDWNILLVGSEQIKLDQKRTYLAVWGRSNPNRTCQRIPLIFVSLVRGGRCLFGIVTVPLFPNYTIVGKT